VTVQKKRNREPVPGGRRQLSTFEKLTKLAGSEANAKSLLAVTARHVRWAGVEQPTLAELRKELEPFNRLLLRLRNSVSELSREAELRAFSNLKEYSHLLHCEPRDVFTSIIDQVQINIERIPSPSRHSHRNSHPRQLILRIRDELELQGLSFSDKKAFKTLRGVLNALNGSEYLGDEQRVGDLDDLIDRTLKINKYGESARKK
jgi:hypothetical protein